MLQGGVPRPNVLGVYGVEGFFFNPPGIMFHLLSRRCEMEGVLQFILRPGTSSAHFKKKLNYELQETRE